MDFGAGFRSKKPRNTRSLGFTAVELHKKITEGLTRSPPKREVFEAGVLPKGR
jgi:hypothetical protein